MSAGAIVLVVLIIAIVSRRYCKRRQRYNAAQMSRAAQAHIPAEGKETEILLSYENLMINDQRTI